MSESVAEKVEAGRREGRKYFLGISVDNIIQSAGGAGLIIAAFVSARGTLNRIDARTDEIQRMQQREHDKDRTSRKTVDDRLAELKAKP